MVVAGADVGVQAQSAVVLAHNQDDLAVGLEAHDSVGHVNARFFHTVRPAHIGGFVEARLELHHHRYLLAVLRRIDEVVDHLGIAGGPVKCYLDGAYLRVPARFFDETFDGGRKRLVGVLQQNRTVVTNNVKEIRRIQTRMIHRMVRRIVQIRVAEPGDLHEIPHAHHAVGGEDVLVLVETELRRQQTAVERVHVLLHHHAHDGCEAPFANLQFDHGE